MKQFNLDEYLANPSMKVVTRGGDTVKIHCTNYFGPNPIIAEIEGSGQSLSYNTDGSYFSEEESVRDLFFTTEKHEGWVNVYKNAYGAYVFGEIFIGNEHEEVMTGLTYIATVKIEWEE